MTAGSSSGIINTSPNDDGRSSLTFTKGGDIRTEPVVPINEILRSVVAARGFDAAARNNPVHRSKILKRFGGNRSIKSKTTAAAAPATPNSTMALLTSTGKFQQSQQHELDEHGQRLHSRTLFDDEDDGMMHMSISNDENDSNTNISESNDESQLSNDSDDLEFEFESDFDMTLSYDSTNNDDRTFDNEHEDDGEDDGDEDDDEFGEERTLSDGGDSMSYLDLDLSLDGSHEDSDEDELEILQDDEQDDEPYAGRFLEQAFENMGLISKDPEKEESAIMLSTGAAVDNLYRRMSRSVSRSMTSSSFGSNKKLLRVISFKRKKSTARNDKKNEDEDEDEDDDDKLYERARSEDLLSKSKSLSRRKNNKQQQHLQKKLSQVQKKISAHQKRLRHLRRFDKGETVVDDEGKNNINEKNVGIVDVDECEYGNDKNEDTTSTGDGDGDGSSDDRTVELIHSFSTEESGTDSPGRKPGDNRNGNGRVLVRVVGTGDDSQDDENKDNNEGVEQDDDDYDEERCGGNGDCSSVATGFINLFPESTVASCKDVAHCATETEMLGNEMLEDVMDPIQQQQVVTVFHEKFTAPCSDSSPLKSTSRSSSRSSNSKIPGNIKNKINKWFTRCAGDIDIASPSSVADVGGGLCGSTDVTTCTDTITATTNNGVVVGRWSTSNKAYDHFDDNDIILDDNDNDDDPKSPPRPKRLPKTTKNLLSFSRVVSSTLLSPVNKVAARGSGTSAYGGINNEDGPNATATATATSTDIGTTASSNALMACGEGAMMNCVTDDTNFGTESNPMLVTNPSIVIGTAASADASSLSSLATGAVRGRSSKLNREERAKSVLPPKRPVDVVPSAPAPAPAPYDDVENDYDTDIINSDAALLQAEAKSLANNLMIQKNKIQKNVSKTISRIINNNKKDATYKSTTATTVAADAHVFTKAMFSSSSSSNNQHDTVNNGNNKDNNVVNNNDCITTEIVVDDDEVDVAIHPFDEINTMKNDELFSPSNPRSCVGCSSSVRFAADVEDFIDDDNDDDDNHNKAATRSGRADSPRTTYLALDDIHTTTPTLSSSSSYHNYQLSDEMSRYSKKAEVNGTKSQSALMQITTVAVTGASPSSHGQPSLLDSNASDDNEPTNNDDIDDELEEEIFNEDEMIEMTEEDIADAFNLALSSKTTKTEVDVEDDSNSAPRKQKKPSGSSSLKRWTSSRRTTKSNNSSSKKKRKSTSVVVDSEKITGGGFDSDVNVSSNNDVSRITSFIRDEDGFEIEMTAITSSSSRNDDEDQQQLQRYDNKDEVLIEVPRRTRTYDAPLVIDTKDPLLLLEDIHIHTHTQTQTQKNEQEQLDMQEEQADETSKKNKKAKTKRKDRRWSKRLNRKMNTFKQQEHNSMNGNNIIIEVEESSSVFDYGIMEQSHDCDEDNNTGFEVHVTQK